MLIWLPAALDICMWWGKGGLDSLGFEASQQGATAGISKHLTNRLPTSVSTYNGHSISVTTDPSYVRDDVDSLQVLFSVRDSFLVQCSPLVAVCRREFGHKRRLEKFPFHVQAILGGNWEVATRAFGGKLPIRGFWYQLQQIMLCHFNENCTWYFELLTVPWWSWKDTTRQRSLERRLVTHCLAHVKNVHCLTACIRCSNYERTALSMATCTTERNLFCLT